MSSQRHRIPTAARARMRGFSLVEVMVAFVIICVGMLGIARINAVAFATTSTASLRSLAAIEAASLGSAMRANRAYWAAGVAPAQITINGTAISDATLAGTATTNNFCRAGGSAPCSPDVLAAYDLHQWVNALNAILPTPNAVISCPTAPTPINCTIQISWTEKTVAVNAQEANGPAMQLPTYTLYVEP